MFRQTLCLLTLSLVTSCNPSPEGLTLGPPPGKALRTTELKGDAEQRLATLAAQTPLANNALFTSYNKNGRSQWNSGWTRRIDFTGVVWSHRKAGAAITPRHIVFAGHYQHPVGAKLTFHDRSGQPHSRQIVRKISFRGRKDGTASDIAVALLDRPLPEGIKVYRLLPPRSDYAHTLPEAPVLVTEQKRHVYIHKVRRLFGKGISFGKNENQPAELYKSLIVGDSGHPSFLLVGGEPVLIETHTGGGPGSGPFYSDPLIFAELQKAVAELDATYAIATVPLDAHQTPAPPEKKPAPQPKLAPAPPQTTPTPSPGQTTPGAPRQPRVRRVPTPAN
ncbi:hypothetical protein [Roseibacillus ishigakijimensis]|uniref:Lipoprotein n=1 Tax=Roseibacillus ishigakijimensis TaxID=454146 RepID=A0A934RRE6_9BACT|nr:hypothetical protein [Roseibacillus ishigakijimensis]MBK1833151.1 hypothetical protein [Roseibacillus ishigakijimensis]